MNPVNEPAEARPRRVLFLCTGNSCRSQMAEGLLRSHFGDRFDALSAGTAPVAVNPGAIAAMEEIGIDISGQRSKHLDDVPEDSIDVVVSVCDAAGQLCPDFPGSQRLHWSIPDPADAEGDEEEVREHFRAVRELLLQRIRDSFDGGYGG